MKDSGVAGVGEMPAHWRRSPLKHHIADIGQGWSPQCEGWPARDDQWGVLKVGCVNGNVFDATENKSLPKHLDAPQEYQIRDGDLLMSRANTRELVGSVALARTFGRRLLLCDKLYRITLRGSLLPEYAVLMLRAPFARSQIEAAASGASASMVNISQEIVRELQVPLPPVAEQRAIAELVRSRTPAIDAALVEHERKLNLLAERRRTLTSSAVTRGIDPKATMRDSGVSWIGPIPATWNIVDLRRLVEPSRPITYGIVLPGENVADGVPIVKSGDCTPERLTPERLHRTARAIEASYGRSRLKGGDLVISIRGTVGLVAQVPPSLEGANLTQDAARIAPTAETDTGWLLHVLRSTPIQIEIAHRTVGATVRGLNLRELRRLVLPVPPKAEQRRIAAFLDEHAAPIDAAAEKTRRAIELLREYRQSLITAAVTGRLRAEETH